MAACVCLGGDEGERKGKWRGERERNRERDIVRERERNRYSSGSVECKTCCLDHGHVIRRDL